jgi:hypothetical protein
MEVSDQLHAPATPSLGKNTLVPIGQEMVVKRKETLCCLSHPDHSLITVLTKLFWFQENQEELEHISSWSVLMMLIYWVNKYCTEKH